MQSTSYHNWCCHGPLPAVRDKEDECPTQTERLRASEVARPDPRPAHSLLEDLGGFYIKTFFLLEFSTQEISVGFDIWSF